MVILDKNLCKKCYIKGKRILFCTNYSTISTNVYCTLKIEEILNLTIFVPFIFLQLRNVRGTYSKYSSNNVSETDILSPNQL